MTDLRWNYRVCREKLPDGDYLFTIREIYYDNGGNVVSWTADPAVFEGDSAKECFDALSRASGCLSFGVLDLDACETQGGSPLLAADGNTPMGRVIETSQGCALVDSGGVRLMQETGGNWAPTIGSASWGVWVDLARSLLAAEGTAAEADQ